MSSQLSGFLASEGKFDLNMVALMGAIGNVLGSLVAGGETIYQKMGQMDSGFGKRAG